MFKYNKRINNSLFSSSSSSSLIRFLSKKSHQNGKIRMSNSEAFVETLVANKVDSCFGIVGSAFMDALDLFPLAGIRFVPVVFFFFSIFL